MASLVKSLRLLADPVRIRILMLLREGELSVAEMQAILELGQSRISTQLAQLKQTGLVTDRRSGKNIIYALEETSNQPRTPQNVLMSIVEAAAAEVPETRADRESLRLVLAKRQDKARAYFDELAGKFGRQHCPGRSWKGLAEMLLKLMPPLVIADLGAGEGTFSQLLAQRARQVIAVDNSPKMVAFGSDLARKHGFQNLEYRLGDIMDPPIDHGSLDVAFLSQALHHAPQPSRAVEAAHQILKPGGRIVILDLLKHQFEEARELYADLWLGFSERELSGFLSKAGFEAIEICIVHKEDVVSHFQTILATASKPLI